jgi:anti-sigma regulatory factor (Ser/Thr protein kinase)
MKHKKNGENGADAQAVPPLPKRTTAPVYSAPLLLETAAAPTGHAMTVPGEPSYAAMMRRYVRTRASLPAREVGSVELLASELFNNCLRHTRSGQTGGEVTISVFKLPGRTQVRITDAGPRAGEITVPHLRPVDPDSECGRGLHLVAGDANRWGTVHHDDGRTSVWFEVDRPGHATNQPVDRPEHTPR